MKKYILLFGFLCLAIASHLEAQTLKKSTAITCRCCAFLLLFYQSISLLFSMNEPYGLGAAWKIDF